MLMTPDQRGEGWTLVLRRQPARIVDGQPQGGYSDDFELICCDCGDDPDLDYRQVPPRLQLIRGPYPLVMGVAAYEQHSRLHHQLGTTCQPGAMSNAGRSVRARGSPTLTRRAAARSREIRQGR